jgi:hypothetical protein
VNKNQQRSTIAGGVGVDKLILKSEMAKNFVFAKQFYKHPTDGQLVTEAPRSDETPGPGAYNADYPLNAVALQTMIDKRYR